MFPAFGERLLLAQDVKRVAAESHGPLHVLRKECRFELFRWRPVGCEQLDGDVKPAKVAIQCRPHHVPLELAAATTQGGYRQGFDTPLLMLLL